MTNRCKRHLHKKPWKSFTDNLFEGVVEDAVEHRVRDGGEHAEQEWQGIADWRQHGLLRKDVRNELVEDRVEDPWTPADKEYYGDASQQDVGPVSPLVDLEVLAWGSGGMINQ